MGFANFSPFLFTLRLRSPRDPRLNAVLRGFNVLWVTMILSLLVLAALGHVAIGTFVVSLMIAVTGIHLTVTTVDVVSSRWNSLRPTSRYVPAARLFWLSIEREFSSVEYAKYRQRPTNAALQRDLVLGEYPSDWSDDDGGALDVCYGE